MNRIFGPQFEMAVEKVKMLKTNPNEEELLNLYGWYKQVTVGDINIEKPGLLDIKGRRKWDAWNKVKGSTLYDAKWNYVSYVNTLIVKYGVNKT